MKHLTIKRAFWSNTRDQFGNVRYGLETESGNRDIAWLASSIEDAEAKAKEVATEYGVNAELIDFAGMATERRAAGEQLAARRAAEAEAEALKIVAANADWSLDMTKQDGFGWPGVVVNDRPSDGRIRVSERLAAIASENRRFELLRSSELLQMTPSERPRYRGNVFGIIEHPEHGKIAVSGAEFDALGLPEVPA